MRAWNGGHPDAVATVRGALHPGTRVQANHLPHHLDAGHDRQQHGGAFRRVLARERLRQRRVVVPLDLPSSGGPAAVVIATRVAARSFRIVPAGPRLGVLSTRLS